MERTREAYSFYRFQKRRSLCLASAALLASAMLTSCTIRITGLGAATSGTPAATVVSLTVTEAYSAAPNWNDYFENTGADRYSANNTACDTDATVDGGANHGLRWGYRACLHGGEIRKVELSGISSCGSLTMTDARGAFDWVCKDSSGTATFFSKGLKQGKGLGQLVDAAGWLTNTVTLSGSSGGENYTGTSHASVWWGNTVRSLDSLPSGQAPPEVIAATGITGVAGIRNDGNSTNGERLDVYLLSGAGVIYVVSQNLALPGFNIQDSKMALVVLPGATLTFNGSGQANSDASAQVGSTNVGCHVCFGSRNYVWIEGSFDGGDYAVWGYSSLFAQLRNVQVRNAGWRTVFLYRSNFARVIDFAVALAAESGLNMNESNQSLIQRMRVSKGNNYGLLLSRAHGNVVSDVITANFNNAGVYLDTFSRNNVLTRLTTPNINDNGVILGGDSDFNTLQFVTTTNSAHMGITLNDAHSNTLTNAMTVNNSDRGMDFTGSTGNQFADIIASNNSGYGIELDATSSSNIFSRALKVGLNSTGHCLSDAANSGNNIDDGATACSTADPQLTVSTTADLSSTFFGQVTVDETNEDIASLDASGFLTFASITDFLGFDHLFRSWGTGNHASALHSWNRSPCLANGQSCAIWDWRIDAGDSEVLDIHGDAGTPFQANAPCPASVHGNEAVADLHSPEAAGIDGDEDTYCENGETCAASPNTYLVNAMEILDDDQGDEDGLCESSEACIYAPNIGSYQGHGELGSCVFDDDGGTATVTGVTLHGYLENGVSP